MKRFVLILLLMQAAGSLCAQVRMRDIFAAAPDSIFPLLTKNNRLDCIDFVENKMTARVRNRLGDVAELRTLTDSYLLLQVSAHSTAEMRLLSDSLFCLIYTYQGPAPDSRVRFFDTTWKPLSVDCPQPRVEEFFASVPDSLQREVGFVQQSLAALRLVRIQASADEPVLTFSLQTSELEKKEREVAQRFVQPLRFRWDGAKFVRQP